ncbi:MAG: hypothetical protein K1X75_14795 [Leptospirales bacterium]|nr:hypothetical protein [Leptospirales bacterium]
MKRIAAVLLILAAGLQSPAYALEEFTRVREPNAEQKVTIEVLTREIMEVQKLLNGYRTELENKSCGTLYGGENIICAYYRIDASTQRSIVPLTAQQETIYGQRQRYVYNEQAIMQWQGNDIKNYVFESRRGFIGKGQVLWRRLSGNSIVNAGAAETPLNLEVNEILASGRGLMVNFRFPNAPDVRDGKEQVEIDGQRREIDVIYVRDPETKINMMREYLRQLRLLERRLDWNIRAEAARREAEVGRLLRSDYDR